MQFVGGGPIARIRPRSSHNQKVSSAEPLSFDVWSNIDIVRSPKRRRTADARRKGDRIEVRVPASMLAEEVARYVEDLVSRLRRKEQRVPLQQRAAELAERYGLPEPVSIEWYDRSSSQWASCTPILGTIRLSSAAEEFPQWVVDYLIIHELAHFVRPGHDRTFWRLVNRYRMAERARGFLIAKDMEHELSQ